MASWVGGYMEFHEPLMEMQHRPETPPVYTCVHCGAQFGDPVEFDIHRIEDHKAVRPVLMFRGMQCGSATLRITEPTTSPEWAALQCDHAWLNGHEVDPWSLGSELAQFHDRTVTVRLERQNVLADFSIRFSIATANDLDGIDAALTRLLKRRRLDREVIEDFVVDSKAYPSGEDYYDGFTTYFYGVLAKERSPESGLEPNDYRDHFSAAASRLAGFDRPAAHAVCAVVAFHYNHFDEVVRNRPSARMNDVAVRFQHLLGGRALNPAMRRPAGPAGLDEAFSDVGTEQVLRWSRIALDGSARDEVQALEGRLGYLEPFDQFKLRIIAAEHHQAAGDDERARRYALELRNNATGDEWARSLLARTGK